MKKTAFLTFLLGIFLLLGAACSKTDKLEGTWSYSFGTANPYTASRMFSENGSGPTFFHSLKFEKKDGARGKFTDSVYPLVIGSSSDRGMLVGSKITGEWEVKDNKLYLHYNDDMQLLNGDALYDEEKDQVTQVWDARFKDWKEKGEQGYAYEIIEKNGNTALSIPEMETPKFKKDKDKTK